MKLKEWFNRKVQASQWIHRNKKMRVTFRWIYLLSMFAIVLLFLGAVALFYLYGLRFNSNKTPPYDDGDNVIYLVFGIIVFLIAMVLGILIGGVYFPLLYKNSRELYMKTDDYKHHVNVYSEVDLSIFKKRELKWLKKLGWISKIDYQQALNKKAK